MAKLATRDSNHDRRFSADGLYAALIVVWIIVVWVVALYIAADATNDTGAGAGGNSFLLGCSLATAGVITALSLKEFWGAYSRWRSARR